MTTYTPKQKQHELMGSHYLANAIKAYRESKSLTVTDFSALVAIPEALALALEAGEHADINSSDVMRLMEVVFPEQFNPHDLEAYSDRISRLNIQQTVVREMVGHRVVYSGKFKRAADYMVAEVSKTLKAQYVGIWLFDENQNNLLSVSSYSLTDGKEPADDYSRQNYPNYFNDVVTRRTLVADYNNPNASVAEFSQKEKELFGIESIICTTLYEGNKPLGVLYTEHVGGPRIWHADELSFHEAAANITTLGFMIAKNSQVRDQQLIKQRDYQQAIFDLSKLEAIIKGDIDAAIPIISERVAQVLKVDVVDVWVVNEDQNTLRGVDEYWLNKNLHTRPNDYSREAFPRFFNAIEQERVVAVDNVFNDERTNEDAALYAESGIGSLLGVAARAQGKMLAAITMECLGGPKHWLPDEISFAGEVSDQLAQLMINFHQKQLKNKHLIDTQSERNIKQALSSLNDGELFNQEDYRESVGEVCRLMSEVLGAHYVSAYLFDEQRQYLNGIALYELAIKKCVYPGRYILSDNTPYYDRLLEEQVIVSDDCLHDENQNAFKYEHNEFNIQALIDVVINNTDVPVGMLSVEYVGEPRQWLELEVEFCQRCAEAINKIFLSSDKRVSERNYQQLLQREKIQNQAALSLLTGKTSLENDVHEIMAEVSKLAAEVLQVEYAGIYLFDDKRECLSAASLYQLSAESFWENDDTYLTADVAEYYQELEKHRTITSEDCQRDERLKAFAYMEEDGVCATADTVIRINGKSVGLLNIEHTQVRVWHSDEIAFMGTVADHVAQVMLADQMRQEGDSYASVAKRREELEHMVNYGQFVLIDWLDSAWGVKFISESVNQFGYQADDFYRKTINYSDRIHAEDVSGVLEKYKEFDIDKSLTKLSFEYRFLTVDGEIRWVEELAQVVRDDSGKIERYYSVIHDISSRKLTEQSLLESKEKMQRMAFYDALTGLENRELFKQQLEHAIKTSHRQKKTVALLYLDIDNFKVVNDTLGHDAGDTLLKIVADRLLACVRSDDTVARMGGDEFTVLLTEVKGRAGTQRAAEKILEAFTKPVRLADQELVISPSIGITLCPEDGVEGSLLMKNADLAMYHAKSQGRNNFQFYTEDMNSALSKRVSIEAELRLALNSQQFELYYQPIIDLNTLSCVSVEALVRWNHPERGLVPPDEFIPVAEDTGLIIPLGEQIFALACEQASLLKNQGLGHIKIAVNLSARQFHDPNLLAVVKQNLQHYNVEAWQLGLEVTESLLMDKVEDAIITLQALKELGFSISIDDFGTGYSSLSYLKRLPIDTVKVDRSFVRDIPEDKNDMEITAAVIAMAHKLNLTVIAEGVEEIAQQQFLTRNNCDFAQGYYYSRPVPALDIVAIIHKMSSKVAKNS